MLLHCNARVRIWHEAADRGSVTSRQILRVEQTCHGRRGTAESDPLLPSAIQSSCVAVFLFDQLVRAQQDRCRHIEAKRLGGRHIEHGLVFHRQLHRQIGRLLALKDAVDVGGGAASTAYLVRPI